MTRYYVIKATPAGDPGTVLYVARRFRAGHGGSFTELLQAALKWEKPEYAAKRIEVEQDLLPNPVHGNLELVVEEVPE